MPSPFTPRNWENRPNTTTPLSEANIEDLETRVTDFALLATNRVVTLGPLTGTVALDPANYPNVLFLCTFSGNTTFTITTSNMPLGGWIELRTVQPATAVTITLPAHNASGGVDMTVTNIANAVDRFGFSWVGGSKPDGFLIGQDIK